MMHMMHGSGPPPWSWLRVRDLGLWRIRVSCLFGCSLHPEMSAYVIVSHSPHFAETDQILGDYFIANVPDGE